MIQKPAITAIGVARKTEGRENNKEAGLYKMRHSMSLDWEKNMLHGTDLRNFDAPKILINKGLHINKLWGGVYSTNCACTSDRRRGIHIYPDVHF